ncbi:hypothetical protein ACTXHP_04845 [Bacillus stercoris]|uniref:hypothetical protein n=1 Tax=Bacillus subtilis group TaxID=653685 RepID=UPI001C218592|nr:MULTISPECIES: hypothetical protein [Bacillus subtilis group]MCY7829899.1 hypothetical protein [Bacillus spizizenii]MBU8803387.1 hypothetical protein [Bacillus subtilis]MCY7842253.1 hypothetical protein [Bacillus spizizenii]MCY7943936.1 hypothetical protein [Bacillus inaquosorum]MCY8706808.1 hypothetical protein [Bacillus inaquosorum]
MKTQTAAKTTEVVTLRHPQFPAYRTYEYHLNGSEVVSVIDIDLLDGERREMPRRKGKRNVFEDNKGKYIMLENYKHYLKGE